MNIDRYVPANDSFILEGHFFNFWRNGNPGQNFLSSPLFSAN